MMSIPPVIRARFWLQLSKAFNFLGLVFAAANQESMNRCESALADAEREAGNSVGH